jgi:hypothetical protein
MKCTTLASRLWWMRRRCESADICFSLKIARLLVTKLQTLSSYWNFKFSWLLSSKCDTLQSPKYIRTFHKTDCCSYIFTARWSRGKRFSSTLAAYLTKYPRNCDRHIHCCGELRTYICSCLFWYHLDVSKRRRVRVSLWCIPYWTSLRILFSDSRSRQEFLYFRNLSTDVRA